MTLISHRGNIMGKKPQLENQTDYIQAAIDAGFQVEIDIWVQDNLLYLGHDGPQYPVDVEWLQERTHKLWIHCKNIPALEYFDSSNFHYFWHQNDEYTLTSEGFIWTYPYKELTENSICVQPEWNPDINLREFNPICYGICSKYVSIIKQNHK